MSFLIPSPPPDASQTRRGLVSTVAQTFSGLKTFLNGLRTSKVVFDDDTEMTTAPPTDAARKGADNTFSGVNTFQAITETGIVRPLADDTYHLGTETKRYATVNTRRLVFKDGTHMETAPTGSKPIEQGAGGILVTELAEAISIALSTTITIDFLNSRSGGWLTVGSNASRVRLGGSGILTHILGTAVVEEGTFRVGPNDSQTRILQHGSNTRVSIHNAPGVSWGSDWNAPFSNAGAYILDTATRQVIITGDVGRPSSNFPAGVRRLICTLPTAIRAPSGPSFFGMARAGISGNDYAFTLEVDGAYLYARNTAGITIQPGWGSCLGTVIYALA